MNKEQREKRNKAIKADYKTELGESYYDGVNQTGSSYVIGKIAKKYKLTVPSVYTILKEK